MAKKFAVEIYRMTEKFPAKEKFGLVSQLNRAAVSMPSNIAEGTARTSNKDKAHFVEIAYGSLMEVACQLDISLELEYVNETDYKNVRSQVFVLTKMLSKLRNSYLEK